MPLVAQDEILQRAVRCLGQGQPQEAQRLLEQGLAERPDYPPFASLRAIALMHQGEGARALQAIEAVVAKVPGWADARANLGYILEALGRHSDAEAVLGALLKEQPAHESASLTLSRLLAEGGRYDSAIAVLQAALQHKPTHRGLLYNLALALRDKGDRHNALQHFATLFGQNPNDIEAANQAASLYLDLGQAAEALALLDSALARRPDFAPAHNNRGTALRELRRNEEALRAYRQACELQPDRVEAWRNLGLLAADLGHLPEAAQALARVLAMKPDDSIARHMLDSVEGRTTAAPPEGFLAASFDAFAKSFDRQLVERLGYSVPWALADKAKVFCPEGGYREAVDIGCGTGLISKAFDGLVERWTGIDLSTEMLKRAEQSGGYHCLLQGEAVETLAGVTTEFDLATAADLLIYLGDILPLFRAVSASLRPDGLFLLSTERCRPEEGDCRLRPTGRYAQSDAYVLEMANRASFACLSQEPTVLRKQHGEDVAGTLFTFRALARRSN